MAEVAARVELLPDVSLVSLEILDAQDVVVASTGASATSVRISGVTVVEAGDVEIWTRVEGATSVDESMARFSARVVVSHTGEEHEFSAVGASRDVGPDVPGVERSLVSAHSMSGNEEVERGAVGTWVELFSGLGRSYPTVAPVSCSNYVAGICRKAGFVLAASPGAARIRVFDPLTNKGVDFPLNVPDGNFQNLLLGTIRVPEGLGDTSAPTVDIQASGTFQLGQAFDLEITATDDRRLEAVELTVGGDTKPTGFAPGGASYSETLSIQPPYAGDVRIEVVVQDSAGNTSRREASLRIARFNETVSAGVVGGTISLQRFSKNIDPLAPIYIQMDLDLTGVGSGGGGGGGTPGDGGGFSNLPLSSLEGVSVYFWDPVTETRIEADGGVLSTGEHVRIEPTSALPFGAELELVVETPNGETRTEFATRGPSDASVLQVSSNADVSGIAVYRDDLLEEDFACHVADALSIRRTAQRS